MLDQNFIKLVSEREPTDEDSGGDFIAAIVYRRHLILKASEIAFEALTALHLDGQEVMTVILDLLAGDVLIDEGLVDLIEGVERLWTERIEPVARHSFQI